MHSLRLKYLFHWIQQDQHLRLGEPWQNLRDVINNLRQVFKNQTETAKHFCLLNTDAKQDMH